MNRAASKCHVRVYNDDAAVHVHSVSHHFPAESCTRTRTPEQSTRCAFSWHFRAKSQTFKGTDRIAKFTQSLLCILEPPAKSFYQLITKIVVFKTRVGISGFVNLVSHRLAVHVVSGAALRVSALTWSLRIEGDETWSAINMKRRWPCITWDRIYKELKLEFSLLKSRFESQVIKVEI